MTSTINISERQREAVAYELAKQFYKLIGYSCSFQDVDELAERLSAKLQEWLVENGARK